MTEEEMEKIADMISNRIFAKIEADTIAFNEEFVDSLPSNEEQIAELQMLLLHYEKQEDYTRAANVFKQIQSLTNKITQAVTYRMLKLQVIIFS
jgi:hypothetical protein